MENSVTLREVVNNHPLTFVTILLVLGFGTGLGAQEFVRPLRLERLLLASQEENQALQGLLKDCNSEGVDTPQFTVASEEEYFRALNRSKVRTYVSNTWFSNRAKEADRLTGNQARDKKVLFSSFRPGSHITARIAGRPDLGSTPNEKLRRAKANVIECVDAIRRFNSRLHKPFDEPVEFRFNWGHHAGWISILDDQIWWGPTPSDVDNHSLDFLFFVAPHDSLWGKFWIEQFELMWTDSSLDEAAECEFNERLCQ